MNLTEINLSPTLDNFHCSQKLLLEFYTKQKILVKNDC